MLSLRFIKALIVTCLFFLLPSSVFAKVSAGDFAGDVLGSVLIVADFVGTASLIVGSCSLFGAIIRYRQHRVNPLAHPLGSVITLFLIGLVLLLLPFAYLITGDAFSYKFFNFK